MKVMMVTDAGLHRTLVGTSCQLVDQQPSPDQQTAKDPNRRQQGHSRNEESPRFPRSAIDGEILPDLHLAGSVVGVVGGGAVVHLVVQGLSSIHWINLIVRESWLYGCPPLQQLTRTSNQPTNRIG